MAMGVRVKLQRDSHDNNDSDEHQRVWRVTYQHEQRIVSVHTIHRHSWRRIRVRVATYERYRCRALARIRGVDNALWRGLCCGECDPCDGREGYADWGFCFVCEWYLGIRRARGF